MMNKLQFLAISSLLYVSQKLPGITFWLFLLFFGQNLKKIPVPDNFQLSIYKLKSPGASYILKVQPLPGNSMLTYSKLGIARNLLHFWKQSGTTFIFDTSFWLFPAHTLFVIKTIVQIFPTLVKKILTMMAWVTVVIVTLTMMG